MEDDDSQDELINRSTSHGKGKRAAAWAISDDSDDAEEESEDGESDSGEGEEEDQLDGEDDDEEEGDEEEEEEEEEEGNEEEDDEEEEGDARTEDGAFGVTSADLAGMSSDEDTDKCPICLNSFSSQPVATPENCQHYFCLDCILAWAKNANSCPVDRIAFNSIYLRKCYGGKVKKMITVQKPVKEGLEETVDLDLEQTSCEVCGGSDREDRLLLCDGCDAGYHMECLTPPLDAVPVEEWFCPECEANNRNSRASAEELSDTESLPSTARPATSRAQSGAAGPTRAIARTQQSERVRANVNRHRITQARTSQLAPTYLIQSTWLDETINAVVAGLNTAVYVRDFTPRAPSSRRRKTGKRRKVRRKKTSAKSKNGKVASTGVKRRKRKARRTKSRKKLAVTPRSRIANNLGIVKDKKSSSLPTVYRPSEHTLSSMRADIGAASLSIYGDPFDLDPFVDREEEEQQATSLLEAKRRGISRSALRSHQPVARPVTASLSRRGMGVPQSGCVVEAAPVPDLLGSILSGQSVLLMDSSDVVINRDGSLKATKPMMPSALKPSCCNSSSSGETSTGISPVMSPSQGDSSPSVHYNRDLPGSSHSSISRSFSHSTSHLCSSSSHTRPSSHSDLPHRGHSSLQPPRPIRPTHPPGHWRTNGVGAPSPSSSIHPTVDSSSKSKGVTPSHSQPIKAPIKPMWVDVSVLPKIPKIKRESSGITNNCTSRSSSSGSDRSSSSSSSRGNSRNSATSSNGYGMPEKGMNSLAGDKGRQQSVDQQKGRADGQACRQRPSGAGPSSAFSNSFSTSSSTGSSANQPRYPSSSSSSSSSVSFRINSSGNSWQSRRLSSSSSSAAGGSSQKHQREKEDEVKKRQLHRDKQMLLASHTPVNKEQDSNTIYDPFNPTMSDSSSSDDEAESNRLHGSSRNTTRDGMSPSLRNEKVLVQSRQELQSVKTESLENEVSQEEPRRASAQETTSQEVRFSEEYVKVEKESRVIDTKTEKQKTLLDIKLKKEPESDNAGEAEMFGHSVKTLNSDTAADTAPPIQPGLSLLKAERETLEESGQTDGDSGHKKTSKERCSSSLETDGGTRGDPHASGQGGRQKEKEKEKERDRSSRRSRSRERRRANSISESSQSNSPRRKRWRSRSRSKDRRRSRSGSSSSSRERSRRKKHQRRSHERNDSRERDTDRRRVSKDKRHGRSRSKSRSKSRSRSRERKKDHTRLQQSSLSSRDKVESRSKDKRRDRSRSRSREKRKDEESSSKSSQKTSGACVSSSKDTKLLQDKKKEKDTQSSVKEEKVVTVNKQTTSSCTDSSNVRKKDKNLKEDCRASTAEMAKEIKVRKEIKKEKQPSLDMFEDFSVNKEIKKEETDIHALLVAKTIDEEGNKKDPIKTETFEIKSTSSENKTETFEIKTEPFEIKTEPFEIKTETFEIKTETFKIKTETFKIKTETCEFPLIKSEPSPLELCHLAPVTSFSTMTTPVTADCHQDSVSPCHPEVKASTDQPDAVGLTVPVKQEVQQPSDSDDDFNVDVMLDNLDCVKSERTGEGGATVKQENEVEEGKNEQVSTAAGAKSKTQVKRVTWNIQEPEGPQPEKSASKLALYKLKLKQEGRRPSSTVQTSSQDTTGAVGHPSKRASVGPHGTSSKPAGVQGEAEEGDLSRKDQYLKKLHMQERAIEEVKLAIKPFYQRRDINKDEYKEILRKAVQKVCHSKSGEINPVKVGNLVKAYVDKYKHARKHKKGDDLGQTQEAEAMKSSDSP
ncbi:PHD and RING finger domain-containing protein 1 [Plectropomus leopardus]|uniref:PHD and RING finger domain-containing protein 1 n=1 Tax=Plectropomus leopardus TaxID=160734 RepID=UPI001C4B9285|nr:PHD and RING finger domain-containing protein 1 [Plectropomus leopardus]XP_042351400.1 PHD and RING finger domain-containing protein 1 [Plectropomus leopardus]XP_042351402.1 PHD and RING finger domain-containing protein 1 [Plectropomus leopardus]